jgi:hypothetical protein
MSCGIDNEVVDSVSLEVNRRLRRTKTDRIDAGKLLSMLVRYHGKTSVAERVPSRKDEDARHLHRELEALKRERTRYRNRIHGILIQRGPRVRNPSTKKFIKELDLMRTWDGQCLWFLKRKSAKRPLLITRKSRDRKWLIPDSDRLNPGANGNRRGHRRQIRLFAGAWLH